MSAAFNGRGVLARIVNVLETPRLRLRPVEERDLPFLMTIFGDARTLVHFPRTYTQEEIGAWVRRQPALFAERRMGLRIVEEKATGAPVGDVGVSPVPIEGQEEVEVMWHLPRASWGRGFATEAARRMLRHAQEDLGLERVVALVLPANEPSRRVAERLGMQVERTVTWADKPHLLYVAAR